MTSATLAVGRPDLAYFRDRIGADEAEPLQLGSPFDFTAQMKLFVVQKMPDPRDAAYDEALAKWVAHFVEETDGRAFVLFTSYRGMQLLAARNGAVFCQEQNEPARAGPGRAARTIARTIQDHAAQRAFWNGQFLDGCGCSGRRAFQRHHHATALCRAGSSADRSEARIGPGAWRRSVHRILVAGSDLEIAAGRGSFDSDEERSWHRRDSR